MGPLGETLRPSDSGSTYVYGRGPLGMYIMRQGQERLRAELPVSRKMLWNWAELTRNNAEARRNPAELPVPADAKSETAGKAAMCGEHALKTVVLNASPPELATQASQQEYGEARALLRRHRLQMRSISTAGTTMYATGMLTAPILVGCTNRSC